MVVDSNVRATRDIMFAVPLQERVAFTVKQFDLGPLREGNVAVTLGSEAFEANADTLRVSIHIVAFTLGLEHQLFGILAQTRTTLRGFRVDVVRRGSGWHALRTLMVYEP